MNYHFGKGLVIPACAALLAACSGGGGGSDVDAFTSFSDVQSNDTLDITGQVRTATLDIASDDTVSNIDVDGPDDVTARLRFGQDSLTRLRIDADNADVDFDTNDGDTFQSGGGATITAVSEDGREEALFIDPDAADFEFQTFGVWTTENRSGTEGAVGVGSFGARTSEPNIPGSGQAVYDGDSLGTFANSSGETFLTTSDIEVQVDFASNSGQIASTGTLASANGSTQSATALDFTTNLSINGRTLSGEITGNRTGDISGGFYGPQAQEVGGTFDGTGSGGSRYAGSFGASR